MSSECFVRYAVSKGLELCACLAMRKLVGTGFYLSLHVMYACNDVMYACNDVMYACNNVMYACNNVMYACNNVMYCIFLCCARFSLPVQYVFMVPCPLQPLM